MNNKFNYVGSYEEVFNESGYSVRDDNPYSNIIQFKRSVKDSDKFLKEHFMNNVEMVEDISLGDNPLFYHDSVHEAWILDNGIAFHIFG